PRQVVRQDAPADPPAHPPLTAVATPLQPIIAPQRVDSSLDPRPEPITPPESLPPLLRRPRRRRLAHVRQRHRLDPRLPRHPPSLAPRRAGPRRRPRAARRRAGPRPDPPLMVGQCVAQIRLVLAAGLLDDRGAGDDPALDFVQPDLAAELHGLARLEPRDHL